MPRGDRIEEEKEAQVSPETGQAPAQEQPETGQAPAQEQPASGGRRPRTRRPQTAEATAAAPPERRVSRLLEKYRQEVVPALTQEFGYRNVMQVPRLQKAVLNIGLGEAILNSRALEMATRDLSLIAGQQPVTRRARKSVAGFKLRQGMPIGVMVTLRGTRMYDFLDKLLNVVVLRIRDFRGTPRTSFDGRGNYSLGIREQIVFPEIDYNSVDRLRGLQVSIATSARTDEEGLRLLELLGMPFARQDGARR